eukprot:10668771-Ditylum_brightwellii.AAC.1
MGKQQMRKFYDIDRDRAVAIAYNKKLQENIIGFETERATKNKEFKNVEAQNQELSKKVESLESELRHPRANLQALVSVARVIPDHLFFSSN